MHRYRSGRLASPDTLARWQRQIPLPGLAPRHACTWHAGAAVERAMQGQQVRVRHMIAAQRSVARSRVHKVWFPRVRQRQCHVCVLHMDGPGVHGVYTLSAIQGSLRHVCFPGLQQWRRENERCQQRSLRCAGIVTNEGGVCSGVFKQRVPESPELFGARALVGVFCVVLIEWYIRFASRLKHPG